MKNKIKIFLDNYMKWSVPLVLLFMLMLFSSLFITLNSFRLDNDFWFLINTGKYIINNGMPIIEPFTVHSELAITVQQWLTDIVFYLIYDKFDVYGMFVFISFVSIVITILIYKISMLINHNNVKLSFITTILTSSLLGNFFITTRPQIFDCLFILMEIYLLELYINRDSKLYLIGLPIISLLMINFHASVWSMLFVLLIPYFLDRFIKIKCFDRDKYKVGPLIIATIIMFFAGFINPYGFNAILYLFNSYGVDAINSYVGEMHSVVITSLMGIVIFIFIFIVLFSYYYNKGNKYKLRYFLLFLGTCYLGLAHYRGMLFLLICSIPSICYNFKNVIVVQEKRKLFFENKSMNVFLICFCVLFIGLYGYYLFNNNLKSNNINYLNNIANYLNDNASKDVKIYTNYNDGGYLEYVGYKCYIDPRAEVFLKSNNGKKDIFIEYISLQKGQLNYKKFLNKYNFDYLVVSENDLLYNYVSKDDGYEIVYKEEVDTCFLEMAGVKYRVYKKI